MESMRIWILILIAVYGLASCSSSVDVPEDVALAGTTLPEELDYNLHIKPILSDRCFKCHGPDKSKIEAGLQLASLEGASVPLESGEIAIIPHDPAKSSLVKRILTSDPEEVMPPPQSHLTLSAEEKAMLIRWIDEGAVYREHWSLQKIEKPRIPAVGKNIFARWHIVDDEETQWVQNDIDRFTLAKMKEKKLKPSGKADKATLLRRVSMDLTGLPPTPEEVQAFIADESPQAYEKAVDKLLMSPHYGEQRAVSWLDLARYADSHGYQDDGMRNVYPYRDWVIKAFNQNLPLDTFVTYQLAGDLLKNPTRDMLIATSFNRQHPQTQEGGIVPEEYHTEYVADRTNTFGKAFLGLTFECARCHDHKYDPILAKDYYSLYAFFNQNKDWGEVPYNGEAAPTVMLPEKEVEAKLQYIRNNISRVAQGLRSNANAFDQYQANVKNKPFLQHILQKDLVVHLPFEGKGQGQYRNVVQNDIHTSPSGDYERMPTMVPGKFGSAIQFRGDCGIQFLSDVDKNAKSTPERYYQGLHYERNQPFSLSFWMNIPRKGISGPVVTRNNGEFEGFRGYSLALQKDATLSVRMMYVYPANGIEFVTIHPLKDKQWHHIALTYDGSSRAEGLALFIDGKKAMVRTLTDNLTKSILHGEHKSNWSFTPMELGKDFRSTIDSLKLDELRIYKRRLTTLEIESLHSGSEAVTLKTNREKLQEFYQWNYDTAFARSLQKITHLRLEETQLVTDVPEVMIMQELPKEQQRKTHILSRGVYDSPLEEVIAEVPSKLGRLPEDYPRNRLGLAQWLLNENNPLFARVMVNGIWLQFFNNGLVKTQEDFGNQGDLPSHPALLDWLALQYREDKWDTKKFIKRIVMSATYQQSSIASAAVLEADPDNRWLARGPSYQYAAEQVRDNALAASGLLVRKIGGASVYPYQPAGIWEALATRNAVRYEQDHGDNLYRRSLYTIWKRSSPPPMMLNFDAPDRQSCAVRRQRTATPLQALITLNDPQFVEAARVLAAGIMQAHQDEEERIKQLFFSAISRPPRPEEISILRQLLKMQQAHYKKQKHEAQKIVRVGEYPVAEHLDPVELAAYTVAANTILNYDEAIVKR